MLAGLARVEASAALVTGTGVALEVRAGIARASSSSAN